MASIFMESVPSAILIAFRKSNLAFYFPLSLQAIFLVNLTNVIFWFVIKPTDDADPVRTIVTR
jgi:hypothetical protein